MWIQFRPQCPPLFWSVEIALNKIQNWNQKLLLPVFYKLLNVRIKGVTAGSRSNLSQRFRERDWLKHMELS